MSLQIADRLCVWQPWVEDRAWRRRVALGVERRFQAAGAASSLYELPHVTNRTGSIQNPKGQSNSLKGICPKP